MIPWRTLAVWLCLASCLFVGQLVKAAPKQVALDDSARFWTAAPSTTGPQEAFAALQEAGRFQSGNQHGYGGSNYGFAAPLMWVHVPTTALQGGAAMRWVLVLDYPPLDDVRLFVLSAQGVVLHQARSGDSMEFAERPVQYRGHAFELPPIPADATVLLRVQTTGVMSIPLSLYSADAFLAHVQNSYALLMMYLGLLLGLAGYNFVLGVQLRDARYGWFTGFSLCMAGFHAAQSGLGLQYLWPNAMVWQNLSIAVFVSLCCAMGVQFTRVFLRTAQRMPLVDLLFKLALGLAAAGLGAALVLPLSQSTHANSVAAAVGIACIVLACIQAVRQKVPQAIYYLLAWATLLVGAVALLMHNNGLVANNLITQYGLLIGSAAQMLLLSLCLGGTMRNAELERARALRDAAVEHRLVQDLQATKLSNQNLLAERDALLNNAVVGMALSVNRQHTWVNNKFVAMMGYERAEMLNRSSQYLYADPEEWVRFGQLVRQSLEAAGSCTHEMALRRKDGVVLWVHMAGALLKPGSFEDGVIWTMLDVTALRDAAEHTRSALAEQQKLAETRERFVAVTSHELRTPVASILGTLELFEHYGERLGETEKADMLRQINRAAQRLWDMTERVLFHGKARAGEIRFSPQSLSLKTLLSDLIDEVCSHPAHPPDRFVQHLPEHDERLMLDAHLIRHILVNLLSNAFKYSPTGSSVRLDVLTSDQTLTIKVSDRGIGIPKADLPHLFQGYVRAGNVGDISGTGLGLSIVKHCVEAHGGRIEVHSVESEGSSFEVHLPRVLA